MVLFSLDFQAGPDCRRCVREFLVDLKMDEEINGLMAKVFGRRDEEGVLRRCDREWVEWL